MILPDVNVLVHAYNTSYAQHEVFKEWLRDSLNGPRVVGLSWAAVLGFIRVSTNPHACRNPMTPQESIGRVREWIARPNVRMLMPGVRHGDILFGLIEAVGVAGKLTSDAHLAALAIEYQAEVVSTDADFSRFPGLRWFNPARPGRK
ncbi:MAG: type II toxin-antitoxin system VapC family toxin [Bryobacteraceae bacterium]